MRNFDSMERLKVKTLGISEIYWNNETEEAFKHYGYIIIPSARGDVIRRQGVNIFTILREQISKRIMSITFVTSSGMIVVLQNHEPGSTCNEENVAKFFNILKQNVNKVKKKMTFLVLGNFDAKRSLK